MKSLRRRIVTPTVVLFFLAPFFGEYLLGNQRLSDIASLPLMAVMYGGGAILIREATRRVGRGYGMMLGLGVAYSLIEEGIVDQMLSNPAYFVGPDYQLDTIIPGTGVNVWLTMLIIAMHAVWSICIPIMLVESIFTKQRTTPWLGKVGLAIITAIFVIGSTALYFVVARDAKFYASIGQLVPCSLVIAAIIGATFMLKSLKNKKRSFVPPTWMLSMLALVASSLFFLLDGSHGWSKVVIGLSIASVFFGLVFWWSRASKWKPLHSLSLAIGGTLTYVWLGAATTPMAGPRKTVDQVGAVAIIIVSLWLCVLAAKRLRANNAN